MLSFDPNIRPALLDATPTARDTATALIARAHVVKLSDEDADWLFPGWTTSQVLDHLLQLGVHIAAVTRGSAGSDLATTRAQVHIPARLVDAVDTVGAGDSYMAGMLRQILREPDGDGDAWLEAIGTAGARNAAFTVEAAGAVMPTIEDLEDPMAA